MSPRQFKTRSVSRSKNTIYLKKAQEFLEAMESSLEMHNSNAAGLNAVHCAISCADALVVFYAGLRSVSESHGETVELLRLHVKDDDLASKASALSKILSVKNLIAYEDREFSGAEAVELAKLTRRFFEWSKKKIKGS